MGCVGQALEAREVGTHPPLREGPVRAPRPAISFALLAALLFGAGSCFAQDQPTESLSCSDPMANPANCRAVQSTPMPNADTPTTLPQTSAPMSTRRDDSQQLYLDPAGTERRRSDGLSGRLDTYFPPDPPTDLQRLALQDSGEFLPIFGRDIFERAPSTFAPGNRIPATANYVLGPGDEVLVRLSGPESFNSQLTVDSSGAIYIPKVGTIQVAGLRFDQLQPRIAVALNRVFRNYNLSVDLGQLRSIQVYVVGEARRPGSYTISSLSTVLNALYVSGGPSAQGSLRRITVRRAGQQPQEFDLYDLVLNGDQAKDIRLEQNDTIYIPAAGPQVALAGSVRHPAIYEIKDETTVERLVGLAGGFSSTAFRDRVSLDRIDPNGVRQTLSVKLDAAGEAMSLRDGDVLFAEHINPGFQKTVTIRGNLANPGRFPWKEGMKLSDIIPDRQSLLTIDYWRERNRLGVPTPLFEPLPQNDRSQYSQQRLNSRTDGTQNNPRTTSDTQRTTSTQNDGSGQTPGADLALGALQPQNPSAGAATLFGGLAADSTMNSQGSSGIQSSTRDSVELPSDQPSQTASQRTPELNRDGTPRKPPLRINIPAPEIDWSYAVIERLDPATLRSSLVPFNLGRLVQDNDSAQDLTLQPGDVVTILSQADIRVPQDEQTKYVRLEGEFPGAGVYSTLPGETLDELVRRAGGFSAKSYLYGSSFIRESARVFQQQRLDEYISTLSTDMEREAAVRAASSSNGVLDPNALLEQRNLVAQLRQMRATGRIVLEFRADSSGLDSVPKISLEDGDVFRVPARPATVSVLGSVYGQNVFLFDRRRHVADYVALAGKPNRIADSKHAFIIRADGSIFSRDRAQGVLSNSFDVTTIHPGDAIVIPEKLVKPTVLRQLLDYSQILSSFGLAAAAINVVRAQ